MSQSFLDLLRASTDTTSTTLVWMLMLLANDQEAQDMMRKEIWRVIGRERFPALSDRKE